MEYGEIPPNEDEEVDPTEDKDQEVQWHDYYIREVMGGPWTPSEERLLWRGAFILVLSMLFTIACMLVLLNIGRINMRYVFEMAKNDVGTKNASSNALDMEAFAKIFASATSRSPFRVDLSWPWGAKERHAEQDLVTGSDSLHDEGRRDREDGETDDSQDGHVELSEW